jgi:lysozyme
MAIHECDGRLVDDAVTVPLSQNEFDALVSLVSDIGAGAFSRSTVLRQLNAGARQAAADAFLLFVVGGAGPENRRRRERELFLTRDTPAPHVFPAPSA